ncbi:hypothetical protein A3I51_00745 [Candidatus Gottesmanbacteria bacterium RIFCSPLOWO2_02_FULL_38_8]|uniref:MurNAc-LAA domain-containing protein n=1 Tax=Candidatus Gottesmanbacteria bacterium RIFCSPLOWO2_02_FULL_38_8 TaxID=1798397 RepID=A0A1F6B2S0_9BACT|nr:MAG: hypothetical protein A3I51_00745 [Candidatus Gottesmanbacteria bacterium RIFCSPLOWO2_02_FULL_38_8]
MKANLFIFLLLFTLLVPQAFAAKPTPPHPIPNSVCIDAGHGGTDSGTSNNELLEKNVNLDVAILLEIKLKGAGYKVFMTRRDDDNLSNADRYNYCNDNKASILISIHHNGSSDASVDFTSALYIKKSDVALANIVAKEVSGQLNIANHGISRFASGVLLKANMPATISEGFFLTNTNEYNLINTAGRLDQEANALLSATQIYFGK